MTPQAAFDWLSEHLEKVLSTWWGAGGYFALCALSGALWGWDGLDRTVYLTGGIIIILLVGSARRDWKAQHAQTEAMLDGEDLKRLEEKSEAEIEEVRT